MRVNIHLVPCAQLQDALLFLNNRIVQETHLNGVRFTDHKPHLTVLMFDINSIDESKHCLVASAEAARFHCPCQLTNLQPHVDQGFLMLKVDLSASLKQLCKVVWESCSHMLPPWDEWRVDFEHYEPHITIAVAENHEQLQQEHVDLAEEFLNCFCKQCPDSILICDQVDVSVVGPHGTVSGTLL